MMRHLAACLAISAGLSAAEVQIVERVVAKVNGDIVIKSELEAHQSDALRERIDTLLLLQKGKDLGINVDSDVTRELAAIQATNAKIADPEKFRDWLTEQSGMSYEDFREQLRIRHIEQRVVGVEVGNKITIPTPELQKYYDEHKEEFIHRDEVFLREILISPPEKKRAEDILARLRKGEKFSDLAHERSDGESAKNNGEIGWFGKDGVIPPLRELWPQLAKGYITDLIKVQSGFAIFKVEERHEAGLAPFEEVANDINEKLSISRLQPKLREYLTGLREQAFLVVREGYADSGAAPGKDTTWRDPARLAPETTVKELSARKRTRLLGVIPLRAR